MKRAICFILICMILCLCAGCGQVSQETVFAMDTVMELKIWGKDADEGVTQVKALLSDLEQTWSVTREASVLSRINSGEEPLLSAQQEQLLADVQALSVRTGGTFDPKLLAASLCWGFQSEVQRVPAEEELAQALIQSKWDLGAAIKGYAGQQAVTLLEQMDVDYAMLNLGGNIQTYGEKPDGSAWSIGIQNPDGGDPIGVVSVSGTASVVTSGDYQRYFEQDGVRYHHILDPQTGRPAQSGLRSVTVICRDGLTADALSTALFVMGLEEGSAFWRQSDDFEAVFILTSGEIYATEGAALSGCEYEVIFRED